MKRKKISSHQDGFIVVLVLIALMAMSFFLMTGAATTTSTLKVSGNYTKTIDGFNLAEVGVAKGRALLEAADFDDLLHDKTENDLPLITEQDFNNGTYEVWLLDNDDGDGNPYVDDDNIVVVRSIGRNSAGGTVQIEAHMQKPTVDGDQPFPGSPGGGAGAGMLCGTTTDASTAGSATISGYDSTPPNLPCVGIGCAPISEDTTNNVYSIVGENTVNESGSGFESNMTPAIAEDVDDTNCDEWKTLRDQLASLDPSDDSVEVLNGANVTTPLNDCDDPKVFIINTPSPTFTFTGTAQVCGIVVVASPTAVVATGEVTIIGLLLIMGESANLSFSASKGTARIYGQVIVESISVDQAKELSVQGSAEVMYSTKGLGYALEAMNNAIGEDDGGGDNGIITMAWKETY